MESDTRRCVSDLHGDFDQSSHSLTSSMKHFQDPVAVKEISAHCRPTWKPPESFPRHHASCGWILQQPLLPLCTSARSLVAKRAAGPLAAGRDATSDRSAHGARPTGFRAATVDGFHHEGFSTHNLTCVYPPAVFFTPAMDKNHLCKAPNQWHDLKPPQTQTEFNRIHAAGKY